jgi:hypothetical protein
VWNDNLEGYKEREKCKNQRRRNRGINLIFDRNSGSHGTSRVGSGVVANRLTGLPNPPLEEVGDAEMPRSCVRGSGTLRSPSHNCLSLREVCEDERFQYLSYLQEFMGSERR